MMPRVEGIIIMQYSVLDGGIIDPGGGGMVWGKRVGGDNRYYCLLKY